MRAWHLLVLTVLVSIVLILREAPSRAPRPNPWEGNQITKLRQIADYHRFRGLQRRVNLRTNGTLLLRQDRRSTVAPSLANQTRAVKHARRHGAANMSAAAGALAAASSNVAIRPVSLREDAPFIAMGVVSNVMWGDSFARRQWIRETWKTYANVGRTMHVVFIVAMRQSDLSPLEERLAERIRVEARQYNDMLLLENVPERKSPCLKTMAWFRHAVAAYPRATFIAKTDDDAFVQTVKLEHNMRRFAGQRNVYIGSTLWGSYITKTFEPCARRMGPMMARGGMKEENCVARGAIGPYPYAVGMLQVLDRATAAWMVAQPNYAEFERRATAATRPPMMDQGEDMVIGMFLYLSPEPIMPLHWGWDKLHDLCFKCERKDQIWRPITHQTVVAHHIANEAIIKDVFRNITRVCDDACQHTDLPFEVQSLADLCSRGAISQVYNKCAMLQASKPKAKRTH